MYSLFIHLLNFPATDGLVKLLVPMVSLETL